MRRPREKGERGKEKSEGKKMLQVFSIALNTNAAVKNWNQVILTFGSDKYAPLA